jgi:tryptophan 2,3-dioxygenase
MTKEDMASGCPAAQGSTKTAGSKDVPKVLPGQLTYNGYLMVNELKQLQVCQSDPAHHDEPLFIVIHQAYELWFKLILHEIDAVLELLREGNARRATFYMRRVVSIMKLLVQQIHILETMAPKDFLGFRYNLSPASGFQSSQFREIEFVCGIKDSKLLAHFDGDADSYAQLKRRFEQPSVLDEFYNLLRRRGIPVPTNMDDQSQEQRIQQVIKIYDEEDKYPDLHDLAETFVEFDELIFFWRAHHVTVVERMIGFKKGTGGSEGVGYLRSTLEKRAFSDLWRLRTFFQHPEAGEGKPVSEGCPFHTA